MQTNAYDAVNLYAFCYIFNLWHSLLQKKGAPKDALSGGDETYLTPMPSPVTMAVMLPDAKVTAVVVTVIVRNTGFSNLIGLNANSVVPAV